MEIQQEEQAVKEFLKRADIRTMKKDLSALREGDALKERDKIATIKTLDEQLAEQQKKNAQTLEATVEAEKIQRDVMLQKNEIQLQDAKKDLKSYATEPELQQIFLFESKRFNLQTESDTIEKTDDPALQLDKNNLLIKIRNTKTELASIVEEEKKLEGEEKFIIEKSQTTPIPSERQSLELRKSELDVEIQETEKKRWAAEKQIEDLEALVVTIDISLEKLTQQKNTLRNTIAGIDKSLREIYSSIMTREEERKQHLLKEQIEQKEKMAGIHSKENEATQRKEWGTKPQLGNSGSLEGAPQSFKEKLARDTAKEEEARKKFLLEVDQASIKGGNQPLENSKI